MYRYREIDFTKVAEKRENDHRGPEIGNGTVNQRVQCDSKKSKRQQVEIFKKKKNEKSKRGKNKKEKQKRNSFQFSREIDEMDDELRDGRERLKYEININIRIR